MPWDKAGRWQFRAASAPRNEVQFIPNTQANCVYFPNVANIVQENSSYYYADGERIAMKNNWEVSYLYGNQLGSVSAVADGSGVLISRSLY